MFPALLCRHLIHSREGWGRGQTGDAGRAPARQRVLGHVHGGFECPELLRASAPGAAGGAASVCAFVGGVRVPSGGHGFTWLTSNTVHCRNVLPCRLLVRAKWK